MHCVQCSALTEEPGMPRSPSGPSLPGCPWAPTGPVFPTGPWNPAVPCRRKTKLIMHLNKMALQTAYLV